MARFAVLSDEAWAQIEPFMPVVSDKGARPFADHRTMVEAIAYRSAVEAADPASFTP